MSNSSSLDIIPVILQINEVLSTMKEDTVNVIKMAKQKAGNYLGPGVI